MHFRISIIFHVHGQRFLEKGNIYILYISLHNTDSSYLATDWNHLIDSRYKIELVLKSLVLVDKPAHRLYPRQTSQVIRFKSFNC